MKKIVILFCLFMFCLSLHAQEGINFEELTYAEALAKAKKENKLVFVDCYTSWCGPCKHMAKTVFTLGEAGDFFNPRFINLKMDMEKSEGVELAKQFKVNFYPTFLLIRPNGTLQHKVVGAGDWESFKAKIEKGLHEDTSLDGLQRRYASGKLDKKEKAFYYQVLDEAGYDRQAEEIYKELMPQLSDEEKLSKDYWFLLENTVKYGSSSFPFIVENLDKLRKNVGEERVDAFLAKYYWPVIARNLYASGNKDTMELVQLKKEWEHFDFAVKERYLKQCELAFVLVRKDIPRYLDMLEDVAGGTVWDALGVLGVIHSFEEDFSDVDKSRVAKVLKQLEAKASTEDDKESLQPYIEKYLVKD